MGIYSNMYMEIEDRLLDAIIIHNCNQYGDIMLAFNYNGYPEGELYKKYFEDGEIYELIFDERLSEERKALLDKLRYVDVDYTHRDWQTNAEFCGFEFRTAHEQLIGAIMEYIEAQRALNDAHGEVSDLFGYRGRGGGLYADTPISERTIK